MLCIDQLESMSLNGVIEEYENYGPEVVMDDEDIVVGALLVIGVAIEALYGRLVNRLRGGEGQIINYSPNQDGDVLMIPDEVLNAARRGMQEMGQVAWREAKAAAQRMKERAKDMWNNRKNRPKRPISVALRGGSSGASMLAWKNSLTRMYHTCQTYTMSPILKSYQISTKYIHKVQAGEGPHLYWTYSHNIAEGNERNTFFGDLGYWDGGFDGNPTEEVPYSPGPPVVPYQPKKNFRVGFGGVVYVFAADWPGTVMNPDPNTYSTTASCLLWADFVYQGTVTTPNYPRKWTSVFANTSWQYITVYGIQYKFDVTNISLQDYVLEISLFKFKADIDAMDYEKQCLAHFGGYHSGTNQYVNNQLMMPIADVNIIRTKRYRIKGCKTYMGNAQAMEGDFSNNRTIKINIKRKYVIKRPLLNSYETNLNENQIFEQYYDKQKGVYIRMMAWPTDIFTVCNQNGLSYTTGISNASPNLPVSGNATAPTNIGNGLSIQCYKKAYFKLDETTATF